MITQNNPAFFPHFIGCLLPIAIVLGGCSTGQQAFTKGKYDVAVHQATKRLKKVPGNSKAIEALRAAYPKAQEHGLENIDLAIRSNDPFKWETVVCEYETMNEMANAIRSTPAAEAVVPGAAIYVEELNSARTKGTQARTLAGDRALAGKTKESARVAYDHFAVASNLSPNQADIQSKLNVAKELATIKVVINPLRCAHRDIDVAFFENRMLTFLNGYQPNKFVRFYSPREARNLGITYPDEIIDMAFDGFIVGHCNVNTKSIEKTREVVVGKTNGNPHEDIRGTVKATITTTHKSVSSEAILDLRINDQSGRILAHEKIGGRNEWCHEWGTYRGDERAVPAELKKIVNQNDAPVPCRQDLFASLTDQIFQKACKVIEYHYSR